MPTALLSCQEVSIHFGLKTVFSDVTMHIHEGARICLIGKNGAGKSTLMKVIADQIPIHEGERWAMPGIRVGMLAQDPVFDSEARLEDILLQALPEDERDEANQYRIGMTLEPLGLLPDQIAGTLSGGQQRRLAIAEALISEPDILLLDEPTNHLDIELIEWLEGMIAAYQGAIVCISHDKAFLKRITTEVFWLDRGRLRVCPTGFAGFEDWQAEQLEIEVKELQTRKKILDGELDWARRGVKARRKRNVQRLAKVKEMREQLRRDQGSYNCLMSKIKLAPEKNLESGTKDLALFHKVCKAYPPLPDGLSMAEHKTAHPEAKIIADQLSFKVLRGDRIGIMGRNGLGKSSFLKMLIGEEAPDRGSVKTPKDLRVSYFDQKRRDLDPTKSVKEILCPNGGDYIQVLGKSRHVCGYLRDFMFDPKLVDHKLATLSGGQKNRLLLARVLANLGDLLILDEPTNDLDMDTLEIMQEILDAFKGTLLIVSHDRDFLDQTVTKILAFEGEGRVEPIIGGYEDYVLWKQRQDAKENPTKESTSKKTKDKEQKPASKDMSEGDTSPKKLTFTQEHRLKALPSEIEALTPRIELIEEKLADTTLYIREPEMFDRLTADHAILKAELTKLEDEWLELETIRGDH